jgi:hypothetical protein
MKFAPMVLLVGALFGQQENATVSGKAVNATTSAPVAGATMTLRRMDFVSPGTAEYSATADAEGKFEFGPVTPGRYRLTGTHTGYVPTTYGARTPRGEGKLLTVGPNAEISWVRMELLPLSTIAGRVVDADGNPARDVQVTVAAVLYPLGTKQYLAARAARSNERGEYRIAGLSPGRYLLMARAPGEPPTYYPGGADVRAAEEFEVGAGQTIDAMNVKLARAEGVSVKVKVSGLTPSGTVSLIPRNAAGDLVLPAAAATAHRDGVSVTFDTVVAGDYLLLASVRQPEAARHARRDLTIGDRAPDEILLSIEEGATVRGRVTLEKGEFQPPSNMRVTLLPRDQGAMMGRLPAEPVDPDGSFEAERVPPGRYAVYVSGVGQGMYLKSVSEQGRELPTEGLEVTGSGAHTLSLVLSTHPGGVMGTVEGEPDAVVLIFPSDPALRKLPFYHRRLRTDARGGFAINDLTPGDYEVVAVDEIEPGANLDEWVMRGVVGRGKSVTAREDSNQSVTLKRVVLGR